MMHDELVRNLAVMDKEAVPGDDGTYTGLWEYSSFDDRALSEARATNERSWCRRLADLLGRSPSVLRAKTEQPYPAGGRTCDLVITLTTNEEWWIEVKGAWPAREQVLPLDRNRPFGKDLGAAAADIRKVAPMAGATRRAAVLLVGFEIEPLPPRWHGLFHHVSEIRAAASKFGWIEDHKHFPAAHGGSILGQHRANIQVHVLLWSSPRA